ncbi:MAG: signal peptidase I [Candidatus Adiutrix sp.]|jgi:signal peptidase I|nr:signal peptidase I [Candidatus Adiutrix sp.]
MSASKKGEAKNGAETKKPTTGQVVKEYAQAIILAVALALVIRSFVLQAFQIPSGSMIPTFLEGDRVLVTKFIYGIRNPFNNKVWIEAGQPERWDVVVFVYPRDTSKDFVKRVVGLPGETVSMVNGQIFINGQKLDDPYGKYDPQIDPRGRNFPPVTVKPGHYFMMGDNRDYSSDSRVWGTVDESLLRGKAWRLYWSWDSSDPDKSFTERFRFSRIGNKVE